MNLPVLYSFRRCPYAMRARLALRSAGLSCELREVVLRDKPQAFLEASPKATVPVLVEPDGTVVEESLDIMHMALGRNDPEGLLSPDRQAADALVAGCDSDFKHHLDRYKYATRYADADPEDHFRQAAGYLGMLDGHLSGAPYLLGTVPSIADIAIAPFVRQFANNDRAAFDGLGLRHLQRWLDGFLASQAFAAVMTRYAQWQPGDPPVVFPDPDALAVDSRFAFSD